MAGTLSEELSAMLEEQSGALAAIEYTLLGVIRELANFDPEAAERLSQYLAAALPTAEAKNQVFAAKLRKFEGVMQNPPKLR